MVTVDNPGNANTTASTGPPSIEGGMRFRQVLGQALRAASTGPPSIEGGMVALVFDFLHQIVASTGPPSIEGGMHGGNQPPPAGEQCFNGAALN